MRAVLLLVLVPMLVLVLPGSLAWSCLAGIPAIDERSRQVGREITDGLHRMLWIWDEDGLDAAANATADLMDGKLPLLGRPLVWDEVWFSVLHHAHRGRIARRLLELPRPAVPGERPPFLDPFRDPELARARRKALLGLYELHRTRDPRERRALERLLLPHLMDILRGGLSGGEREGEALAILGRHLCGAGAGAEEGAE